MQRSSALSPHSSSLHQPSLTKAYAPHRHRPSSATEYWTLSTSDYPIDKHIQKQLLREAQYQLKVNGSKGGTMRRSIQVSCNKTAIISTSHPAIDQRDMVQLALHTTWLCH
eukprot:6478864-Amphidinium_carterae.1